MKQRTELSGNELKLIAIAAMTLDHLLWTVVPGYDRRWWVLLGHTLGRITAPVMWFFLSEGFFHTRNLKKYILRMFLLALFSHFAYNFCFGISVIPLRDSVFNQTGVAWSLAWGLVLLWLYNRSEWPDWLKLCMTAFVCLLTFPSDWSCVAAMAVLFIGSERGNFRKQMLWMLVWTGVYALVYILFLDPVYGLLQLGTALAIPLLKCYNGTRGSGRYFGKLFYIYYPVHLAVFGILRLMLR